MVAHQMFDTENNAAPGIENAFIQSIAVTPIEMPKEKFVAVCFKNISHPPRDHNHLALPFVRAYQHFLDSYKNMKKVTPENANEAALRLLFSMFYLQLNEWR